MTSHPLIVKYEGYLETEDQMVIIMEYISNGDLFHKMRRRRLHRKEIIFVAGELLVALEYLHSLNIVYRDLKPENIMIHYSGHLRLVDFGLSKILPPQNYTTSVYGSPEYIAPEILSKQGYGREVDLWSLGVLIFELLAGVSPFKSES